MFRGIKFKFWQRWLFGVSLVLIVFGLALAFFNQTATFDLLFNDRINPMFWGGKDATADVAAFQGWIYGVLGATVAGWGITMAFIARYPFARREKWAWDCLATGLLVWFVADTALSLRFGVIFNALFNLLLFVAAGLPLAFTRGAFGSGEVR
jgi:hypothetical protein